MLFTDHCPRFFLHYACLYITLVSFLFTSITPLYSNEELSIPKGIVDNINPAKKLKKIKKFTEKLGNFNENTSFKDLSDFMKSFKKFAEKEIGRKISLDDLSFEVNKQTNALNIPINPAIVKECLSKLLTKGKHKFLTPQNQEEFAGSGQIALGCVCIACSVLIAAVGYAVPPLAVHCSNLAYTFLGLGGSCIISGLTQDEKNRKSLILQ